MRYAKEPLYSIPGVCYRILSNLLRSGDKTRRLVDEACFVVALDAIVGDNRPLKKYALDFMFQFFTHHLNPVCMKVISKNPDLLDFLLGLITPENNDWIEIILENLELLLRIGEAGRSSAGGQNLILETIKGLESAERLYQVCDLTNNRNSHEIQSRILNYYLYTHY
jgi:hypothetical protein